MERGRDNSRKEQSGSIPYQYLGQSETDLDCKVRWEPWDYSSLTKVRKRLNLCVLDRGKMQKGRSSEYWESSLD